MCKRRGDHDHGGAPAVTAPLRKEAGSVAAEKGDLASRATGRFRIRLDGLRERGGLSLNGGESECAPQPASDPGSTTY